MENIKENVDIDDILHISKQENAQKIAISSSPKELNSQQHRFFYDRNKLTHISEEERSRYKKQYRHHKNFPTLNGSRRFGLKFT